MKALGEQGLDVLVEEIKKRGSSGSTSLRDGLDAYITRLYNNLNRGDTYWGIESSTLIYNVQQFLIKQIESCGVAVVGNENKKLAGIFDNIELGGDWSWKYENDLPGLIHDIHACIEQYQPHPDADRPELYVGCIGTIYNSTNSAICVKYSDLI